MVDKKGKYCVLWATIPFLILVLITLACGTYVPPTPIERDFTLLDILIALSDMPDGWTLEQPADYFKPGSPGYEYKAAGIVFVAETEEIRKAAGMDAYRSRTVEFAIDDYETDTIKAIGSGEFVHTEWPNPEVSADQEDFYCQWIKYKEEDDKDLRCSWTARYEEYRVWFLSVMLPNIMSFEDFSEIVKLIDSKMVELLGWTTK